MRKLILEEWVSLDGFVADSQGKLDFFTGLTAGPNKHSDLDQLRFLESVDTILLGRKTYQLFVAYWPEATTSQEVIADQLNQTTKLVFSNTLAETPWGKWPAAQVVNGDAVLAIQKLKSTPGKDLVLWGSISLAQQLMKAKLIDEYHIQLCPVLTGGGRPLFTADQQASSFHLEQVRRYDTGTVFLNYKAIYDPQKK